MSTPLVYTGRTWVFGDNINTGHMLPGTIPSGLSWEDRAQYCMSPNRPGWAAQVQKGDILIAGSNFGIGSSRPAARILKVLGIGCVAAENITSLMLRNSINWALPAIPCPGVSQLFEEGDPAEINLTAGTVTNTKTGKTLQGQQLPEEILAIIRAGGIIPLLEKDGYIQPLQS
jgi:3-isopropylmalate/(R)-2-methylmalate dehydratase small subunit